MEEMLRKLDKLARGKDDESKRKLKSHAMVVAGTLQDEEVQVDDAAWMAIKDMDLRRGCLLAALALILTHP